MGGARFTGLTDARDDLSHALNITGLGQESVILVTFMVLGVTLLTSLMDKRFSAQALELEASEKRFRSVFEGAEIGIAISDLADGTITSINPAYLKMLGCTTEELKSVGFFDELTHPEDREADKEKYEYLLSGEQKHVHLEKRYLRDKQVVWANLDMSVLRDGEGKEQYVLGLASDIT